MPRIKPLEREDLEEPARSVFDRELARFGRLTNMKRTLMHSLPAYHALMQWYPLFDTIKAFLGEQLAVIFAHAISAETDCLICTTFMRRLLIESKCNPDDLKLDDKGNALVDFGRSVARQGNRVSNDLSVDWSAILTRINWWP